MDIWHAVQAIVMSGDWKTLAIIAVIAIGAGVLMSEISSLLNATLVALIAFALVEFVLAIVVNKQPAGAAASAEWQAFVELHALTLLAYALVFAVVIGVANTAKSLIAGR
jgi:hypothetical protein